MNPLRIHGVPIHPVLVHFPVAGWTAATFLAAFVLFDGSETADAAARWCNVAGIVTGAGAMAAGFLEIAALPAQPQIRIAVARHFLLAGAAFSTYLLMLFLQMKAMPLAAAITGGAGFVLLIAAGHAGARLVYHHGLPVRTTAPDG